MLFQHNEDDSNAADKRPKTQLRLFLDLLSDCYFDLIKLNFIFLLFCIPIVTIPAAITGMARVASLIVRGKEYHVWQDFLKGFRSDFLQSFICGIIFGLVYYLTGVAVLYYATVMQSSWYGLILIIFFAFLLSIPVIISFYCFSLIATVRLPLFGVIKNSFMLTFLNFKKNMFSLLVFVVVTALTIRFYPISLVFYILPVWPLTNLINMFLQFPAIEKYIVAGD